MERVLVIDLEVAQSEVNSEGNVHFPTLFQELDQTGPHVHDELNEGDFTCSLALVIS